MPQFKLSDLFWTLTLIAWAVAGEYNVSRSRTVSDFSAWLFFVSGAAIWAGITYVYWPKGRKFGIPIIVVLTLFYTLVFWVPRRS